MPADNGNPGEPRSSMPFRGIAEMLDHLTDGILISTRDGWIRYANQPAGEMLGRSLIELVGRNLWVEFPEGVGNPYHRAVERAWESGDPQRLVEYYDEIGRWFESRVYPQTDKLFSLFRDVTDERRTEAQLREYVARINEAERIVGFGIWEWDVERGEVSWSDELHRIYGLRPGEFEGTIEAFVAHVHPDDRERVWTRISEALATHEPFAFEERIRRADGEIRKLISQGRVVTGPDGSAQAMVGVCHDVTERVKAEQALGASERRMRAIVDNTPSMITVKDLDGRYLMGNAEAEKVAGIEIEELIGKHCEDVFPPEVADGQRANDQRAASEGEPVYGETTLAREGEERTYVTVTFPLRDEERVAVETCTIATDVTERKEREGQRRERIEWEERVRTALEEGRMVVYAQPIVDLESGERVSNELLTRMRNDGRREELLTPCDFLLAAERFELIQEIDVWMVRQALALPLTIAPHVNLSAVTLSDAAARAEIVELLAAAPAAARGIVFEITETASVVRLAAAREFATTVRGLGCRIALDDFGVGFGSFTYLRSLPLTYIKIDISFVRGLRTSADDRRVVEGIIGIAREFGLQTIAEGIEDEQTQELLREMGAEYGQGDLLGPAAPVLSGA
jgi:PAS domain S-box-containing protein